MMLKCIDVCKNFGEKVALDHVSVDIPKGKIFGLLGLFLFPVTLSILIQFKDEMNVIYHKKFGETVAESDEESENKTE